MKRGSKSQGGHVPCKALRGGGTRRDEALGGRTAAVPQHPPPPGPQIPLHALLLHPFHTSGDESPWLRELPPPRGRTGDSPITRSPLLILITPLRPFLSSKTLTQVLRGTGSLLLVGRRAEKKWVRALPGWAQPLGPVLANAKPPLALSMPPAPVT